MSRPTSDPRTAWQALIGVGGALFFIGGGNHPQSDETTTVGDNIVDMLAQPSWYWAHSLILAGSVLVVAGLVLAMRSRAFRDQTGVVAVAAVVGGAVWLAEAFFHLFAKVDLDAELAGESTPILSTHEFLAPFGHAMLFFPLAVIAVQVGRHWPLWFRPLAGLGVFGATIFGLAAPLVVWRDDVDMAWMFPVGAIPTSLWLVSLGVLGTYSARGDTVSESADVASDGTLTTA